MASPLDLPLIYDRHAGGNVRAKLITRASVGARVIKCKPFFFPLYVGCQKRGQVPGVPSGDRGNWARESCRSAR